MKKSIKKIMTLVVITTLVSSLAACKNTKKDTGKTGNSKTPITVSYFITSPAGATSPNKMSDTVIGKKIVDATGVDLQFEYLVGDLDTKVGVMTASGDYPDIIMGSGGSTPKFLAANAFIPIEKYIDKSPDLKAAYKDVWERVKDKDGHITYIAQNAPVGNVAITAGVGSGFGIQRKVLEEMGWPKIKTVDQYFEVIKQYKDKHPTIDGKPTIGFLPLIDGWRDSITWANEQASGFKDGIIYDAKAVVDTKAKKAIEVKPKSEGEKKILQILNKAYNQGLVDPEGFTQKYDQYSEKMATGRVLGMWDSDWDYGGAEASLIKQGKEDSAWYLLPLTFEADTKLPPQVKWVPAGEGVGITTKAKNPERIMELFNYMSKTEVQIMINWGIEGQDYNKDSKGRFIRNVDQINRLKDPTYVKKQGANAMFRYGFPSTDGTLPDGNAIDPAKQPEVAKMAFDESTNKFLKAYNLTVPADLLNKESVLWKWSPLWNMTILPNTPVSLVGAQMGELQLKWVPKIIMDKQENFDKNYNSFISELNKLDLKGYLDGINKEIEMREKNW